ncbi:MAG: phosphotransferase [Alphaproteobacteria bacterium]|jgi:N-acetylmuramate 1-kinase|nr:phosphotransferase [Rhodospirillaceae bacterium]MBT6205826.1 phosphotransferase [Rhodospirillaceae bacterium]MBT6511552.1 phosphotransferase [Rhodospirillaceae bacterium]MBT7647740.1 phosphotransferase [Rhodospirillaceae bacterium]MDG2482533.1 phosphotransferase [Alphaproteobacteria bacterium]
MTERRDTLIATFLAKCGWQDAERWTLAGDASFRRYDRLEGPRGRAVLMDAPPPEEDIRPFVRVAQHLTSAGLAAPEIFGQDPEAGLLLLEDLGDDIYTRTLARGGDEEGLYVAAIEALAALHRGGIPGDLPPYDDDLLLFELSLLTDWFMPLAGLALSDGGRRDFVALWRDLLPLAHLVPDGVVLRDYHADNLLWLPQRESHRRVGQLDFQDAVIGPVTYDIVSLLEDARRDVAPATVEAATARYLQAFPDIAPADFATSYAVMGAQRNLKIAGIFSRLLTRDGKPGYQDYMARVWGHIAHDLEHPALAPLAAWLDRWIPPAARKRAA